MVKKAEMNLCPLHKYVFEGQNNGEAWKKHCSDMENAWNIYDNVYMDWLCLIGDERGCDGKVVVPK